MARLIIEKCCYILSAKHWQIKKKSSKTLILNELGRIFDKNKVEEQQELAAIFGEEIFRLVHNLPDDGSG